MLETEAVNKQLVVLQFVLTRGQLQTIIERCWFLCVFDMLLVSCFILIAGQLLVPCLCLVIQLYWYFVSIFWNAFASVSK